VWPRRFIADIGGSGEDYFSRVLGFEPEWQTSHPDLKFTLTHADAALIIGDPANDDSARSISCFRSGNVMYTSSPASDLCLCDVDGAERKASKRLALWILRRRDEGLVCI
jgi:hypothetical protein